MGDRILATNNASVRFVSNANTATHTQVLRVRIVHRGLATPPSSRAESLPPRSRTNNPLHHRSVARSGLSQNIPTEAIATQSSLLVPSHSDTAIRPIVPELCVPTKARAL